MKPKVRFIGIITKAAVGFLLIIFLNNSPGDISQWKWIGIPLGSISQIIPDRKNPNIWFIQNNNVVYKSTNGARTWKSLMTGTPALSPSSSELFVLSSGRLWSSTDLGGNFNVRSKPDFYINHLVPHPTNGNILFALGDSYDTPLRVSPNCGRTWEKISNLPIRIGSIVNNGCDVSEIGLEDLVVSPFDSNVIFVSGWVLYDCADDEYTFPVLFATYNSGRSWELLEKKSYSFHMDPLFPDRAFAFSKDEIRILKKNEWKVLARIKNIRQIISVPRHPDELLALQDYYDGNFRLNVLKSRDQGKTWIKVSVGMEKDLNTLQSMDDKFRGLLGGTQWLGLYQRNELHGWQTANTGSREAELFQITGDESHLYAATFKFLFAKNPNTPWRQLPVPEPDRNFGRIAADPKNSNRVAFLSRGLWLSENGGTTWRKSSMKTSRCCIDTVVFHPADSRIVYASFQSAVYKSLDGGSTFRAVGFKNNDQLLGIVVDDRDTNFLLLIYDTSIYRSNDGGETAVPAYSGIGPACNPRCFLPLFVQDITPLGARGSYLAVTFIGRIYRTNNSGDSWELMQRAPAGLVERIWAIDRTGNHLIIKNGVQLIESKDAGKSWRNISQELGSEVEVNGLTDPRKNPWFVGTNHGVYVRIQD